MTRKSARDDSMFSFDPLVRVSWWKLSDWTKIGPNCLVWKSASGTLRPAFHTGLRPVYRRSSTADYVDRVIVSK